MGGSTPVGRAPWARGGPSRRRPFGAAAHPGAPRVEGAPGWPARARPQRCVAPSRCPRPWASAPTPTPTSAPSSSHRTGRSSARAGTSGPVVRTPRPSPSSAPATARGAAPSSSPSSPVPIPVAPGRAPTRSSRPGWPGSSTRSTSPRRSRPAAARGSALPVCRSRRACSRRRPRPRTSAGSRAYAVNDRSSSGRPPRLSTARWPHRTAPAAGSRRWSRASTRTGCGPSATRSSPASGPCWPTTRT